VRLKREIGGIVWVCLLEVFASLNTCSLCKLIIGASGGVIHSAMSDCAGLWKVGMYISMISSFTTLLEPRQPNSVNDHDLAILCSKQPEIFLPILFSARHVST
jgi:hypothetical protein